MDTKRNHTVPAPQATWYTVPLDVRLMIYRRTWEPRIVTLDKDCSKSAGSRYLGPSDGWEGWEKRASYLTVHSPPPLTLHLCAEAREETLRHYRPVFESFTGSVAYVNPETDMLYVKYFPTCQGPGALEGAMGEGDTERILEAVSRAKHVLCSRPQYDEPVTRLARIPECDPERFRGVLTVDYCERFTRDGKSAFVWGRRCRVPGCKAPRDYFVEDISRRVYDRKYSYPPPSERVYRVHMLKHVGTWRRPDPGVRRAQNSFVDVWAPELDLLDFPHRECEEIAVGAWPCDVANQVRDSLGMRLCDDPACPMHDRTGNYVAPARAPAQLIPGCRYD